MIVEREHEQDDERRSQRAARHLQLRSLDVEAVHLRCAVIQNDDSVEGAVLAQECERLALDGLVEAPLEGAARQAVSDAASFTCVAHGASMPILSLAVAVAAIFSATET